MDPKTISIFVALYVMWVVSFIQKPKRLKKKDWESYVNPHLDEDIYHQDSGNSSFYEDKVRPYIDSNKGIFDWLVSFLKIDYEEIKQKVYQGAHRLTADELIAIKVGSIIIGGGVTLIASALGASGSLIFGLLLITIVGFIYPTATLNEAVRKRKEKIRSGLPDFLDLLNVMLDVGTPIQDAILEVADATNDETSVEFKRAALASKYMGGQYVLALEEMADKLRIEEISNLVSSIKIATEKGTPIAGVLKEQAKNLRFTQSQEYEEKAAKLTVKLIPVMALFILLPMMGILTLPAFFQ